MEENKDEEHLDYSVNQSENPTEEIISIENPETSIKNQQTENMEVHHHAHDPAAPHHKKNWKSYFWEFLMLFLAVFCGFLAESYHTHLVNKEIEKRNIQSYVNSIKKDADNLKKAINGNRDKIKLTDSLGRIPGDFKDARFQKDFFSYSGRLVWIYDFSPDESAFLNMQSSGTLRLIEKQNILDSILKYQSQNIKIKKHQESTNKIYFAALDNLLQVTDLRKDPPQFNGNNQQLQTYINNKILESGLTETSITFLEQQLKTATNLIALIKNEYNLDD